MEVKKGIIVRLHQYSGYGFIRELEEKEHFFHESGVCSGDFKDLREGMDVEFIIVEYSNQKEHQSKAIGIRTIQGVGKWQI